jgi:hypothetical protein
MSKKCKIFILWIDRKTIFFTGKYREDIKVKPYISFYLREVFLSQKFTVMIIITVFLKRIPFLMAVRGIRVEYEVFDSFGPDNDPGEFYVWVFSGRYL